MDGKGIQLYIYIVLENGKYKALANVSSDWWIHGC